MLWFTLSGKNPNVTLRGHGGHFVSAIPWILKVWNGDILSDEDDDDYEDDNDDANGNEEKNNNVGNDEHN